MYSVDADVIRLGRVTTNRKGSLVPYCSIIVIMCDRNGNLGSFQRKLPDVRGLTACMKVGKCHMRMFIVLSAVQV